MATGLVATCLSWQAALAQGHSHMSNLPHSCLQAALCFQLHPGPVCCCCAGDSRAVISQSGKAIELTRDHKPHEPSERERIESSGGYVCQEGLLNGELAVARAIGDYHIPELKQLDAGAPHEPAAVVQCWC